VAIHNPRQTVIKACKCICLQNEGFCCLPFYLLQLNVNHYLANSGFQRNIWVLSSSKAKCFRQNQASLLRSQHSVICKTLVKTWDLIRRHFQSLKSSFGHFLEQNQLPYYHTDVGRSEDETEKVHRNNSRPKSISMLKYNMKIKAIWQTKWAGQYKVW